MANYTTNPTCTRCGFKLKRGKKIPNDCPKCGNHQWSLGATVVQQRNPRSVAKMADGKIENCPKCKIPMLDIRKTSMAYPRNLPFVCVSCGARR